MKRDINELEGLNDLDSLLGGVADLNQPENNITEKEVRIEGKEISNMDEDRDVCQTDSLQAPIWEKFSDNIKDEQFWKRQGKQRACFIDSDIVDTIGECEFKGMSRNAVINAMLRTFIIECRKELSSIRRQRVTLLDT